MPVVSAIAGCIREYAAVFFSVMLHEMGHIAFAGLNGIRTERISVTAVGFAAGIEDSEASRKVLLGIYAAGPAVNLLLCAAGAASGAVFPDMKSLFSMISVINLMLGAFNLLPAFPLDGGRILNVILSRSVGLLRAGRIIRKTAWLISAAMLPAGIYQAFRNPYNISLIMVGLYIQVILRNAGTESGIMNIRQLLYRRNRLFKKGIYPARSIVVLEGTKLGETLDYMDFDSFHLVYVLNDKLSLLRVFTENEIMAALSDSGENITFGRLLEKAPPPV